MTMASRSLVRRRQRSHLHRWRRATLRLGPPQHLRRGPSCRQWGGDRCRRCSPMCLRLRPHPVRPLVLVAVARAVPGPLGSRPAAPTSSTNRHGRWKTQVDRGHAEVAAGRRPPMLAATARSPTGRGPKVAPNSWHAVPWSSCASRSARAPHSRRLCTTWTFCKPRSERWVLWSSSVDGSRSCYCLRCLRERGRRCHPWPPRHRHTEVARAPCRAPASARRGAEAPRRHLRSVLQATTPAPQRCRIRGHPGGERPRHRWCGRTRGWPCCSNSGLRGHTAYSERLR